MKSTADAEVEEDADAMLGGLEESHAAEGSAIPTEPGAPGAGVGAAANSSIHEYIIYVSPQDIQVIAQNDVMHSIWSIVELKNTNDTISIRTRACDTVAMDACARALG